jgi:hypothetical protein
VGNVLAAILALEGIAVALAIPVAIAQDRGPTAAWVLAGLALALLLGSGVVRRPRGVVVGWVLQAAVLAAALLVPALAVLGLAFLAVWVTAVVLGARAEQVRRAAGPAEDEPG